MKKLSLRWKRFQIARAKTTARRQQRRGMNKRNRIAWQLFKSSRRRMYAPGTTLMWPSVWRGFISAFRQGKF